MTGDQNGLGAVEPQSVLLESALVTDWVDGPVSGFVKFTVDARPWRFDVIAERFDEDDLDDRLFALSPVPEVAYAEALTSASVGRAATAAALQVVVPGGPGSHSRLDDALAVLEQTSAPRSFVIRSRTLTTVTAVWTCVGATEN